MDVDPQNQQDCDTWTSAAWPWHNKGDLDKSIGGEKNSYEEPAIPHKSQEGIITTDLVSSDASKTCGYGGGHGNLLDSSPSNIPKKRFNLDATALSDRLE
jgi:hypothetical protein